MIATESETALLEPPVSEIKYCHIDDGSGERALCAAPDDGGPCTCPPYDGEDECPSCGLPTCPRCRTLEYLDMELLYA